MMVNVDQNAATRIMYPVHGVSLETLETVYGVEAVYSGANDNL
jgi:hypothetical protein